MERKSRTVNDVSSWKRLKPFFIGGFSGMAATSLIQPVDMVKVRLQLVGEGGASALKIGAGDVIRSVVQYEGLRGFYSGLSAALLRQATYTTVRLGFFRGLSNKLQEKHPGESLPFWEKAVAGLTAGGVGSIVGVPADLALVRMQADGTLPVGERRNYTGAFNALQRIVKEEGAIGLFRGAGPTVGRAMALNMAMLSSYDQSKEYFSSHSGSGFWTNQFPASAISGLLASGVSLPFDFIKTRLMRQKPDAAGVMLYRSATDCALKVMRTEGPLAFYRGFATYYLRVAPHAMLTLLFFDAITSLTRPADQS